MTASFRRLSARRLGDDQGCPGCGPSPGSRCGRVFSGLPRQEAGREHSGQRRSRRRFLNWYAPATMRPDMLVLHVISKTYRPAGAPGSLCAGAGLTAWRWSSTSTAAGRARSRCQVVDHQLEGSSSWRGYRTSGDHFVSRGSQLAGRLTIKETGGSGHGGTYGHGMATTNLLLGTNRIDHHSRYRSVTTKRGER